MNEYMEQLKCWALAPEINYLTSLGTLGLNRRKVLTRRALAAQWDGV